MRSQGEYKFWVSIMSSLTGTLYIGVTGELYARVFQHKAFKIEGFSATHKCVRLAYYEVFDDVKKAIAREKQLKRWRHEKKIALIEKINPRWKGLAEHWGREILFRQESMGKTP